MSTIAAAPGATDTPGLATKPSVNAARASVFETVGLPADIAQSADQARPSNESALAEIASGPLLMQVSSVDGDKLLRSSSSTTCCSTRGRQGAGAGLLALLRAAFEKCSQGTALVHDPGCAPHPSTYLSTSICMVSGGLIA